MAQSSSNENEMTIHCAGYAKFAEVHELRKINYANIKQSLGNQIFGPVSRL